MTRFSHTHAGKSLLPAIESLLADPVLTTHFNGRSSSLGLTQNAGNLLVAALGLLH
jgi:hypothetical protein